MFRRILPAVALAAAVFGPVAVFSASDMWSNVKGFVSGIAGEENPDGIAEPTGPDGQTLPGSNVAESLGHPLEEVPMYELDQVLRFDVTTGWIMGHWPRVSTGLAHLQLQGHRVPLVTGTAEDDLAGALTYYFNPQQQVQRITFRGTTGNARKLVRLVMSRYGLARRITNDAGLFLYETAGPDREAGSVLEIRPSRVVAASNPLRRFEVLLTLERPAKK